MVSFGLRQRAHEMGVRKALGATTSDIGRLLLGEGVWLSAAGIALGLPAALALVRLLSGLLYQVRPSDPWVLVGVPITLVLAVLLAVLPPAWRGSRIDPLVSLRQD